MKSLTYTVVLERNEDCGYTVTAPALEGCVTQGSTIAEALSRAKEAIECHLEGLAEVGLAAPEDCKVIRIDTAELSEAIVSKIVAEPEIPMGHGNEKVA
jgi:predicted RNase H-like HicB family nuclease